MNSGGSEPLEPFMEDPDVRLMLAFQGGDDAAFESLVERHTGSLVNFFYYQSGDRGVAEDCTQEVWARILRSRRDYEPRARFRTFLFRVARNLWIDHFRSGSWRQRSRESRGTAGAGEGLDRAQQIPSGEPPPDRPLREAELAAAVAAALKRLPPEMREVFILGGIESVPYGEIAATLGIPVGTVKSRMFNAVRRLQDMLRPYWEREK